MLKTAVLGYPRIGQDRELKKATESYWRGETGEEALRAQARRIRKSNWLTQRAAGIDSVPSNDFSLYDAMLDMTALLGAVPPRYGRQGDSGVDLHTYFAMARGKKNVTAMEMTKWFDTNYHYIVPEFYRGQRFTISSDKPVAEFKEAQQLGIMTRPVLIGPITYLLLGKSKDTGVESLDLLEGLLGVYATVLKKLAEAGAREVQMDEPVLATDLSPRAKAAFKKAYRFFAQEVPGLSLMLTGYFGPIGNNLALAVSLPVQGLHLDLVRAPEDLNRALKALPKQRTLSLGIVDGRNVWKNDFAKSIALLRPAVKKWGQEKCLIASSCSLLHSPLDLDMETSLSKEIKPWLAFASQKLDEIHIIRRALAEGEKSVAGELRLNINDLASRKKSRLIHRKSVISRMAAVRSQDTRRKSTFKIRQSLQRRKLGLPLFPTTTIGSFPQTIEVRQARADFKKGALDKRSYERFLREKTKDAIRRQQEVGLDILVHGEFERNDMVEYFGERLDGFFFTKKGWVQSYGTRYVKPPVIYGDVERPRPMTVVWARYAQSLTSKPVKGMLTGPITILQWSFVRDDQPRSFTAKQIALAIRDEVLDLEKAGIQIIQIDEPALREGLPLRKKDRPRYLDWAVSCFKLASAGVKDQTQIHTHMCYSEFNDILKSIAAMDADVISIETSRSQMELLDAFAKFRYPNEIGPGVYDIHSPRVPTPGEIKELLKKAGRFLPSRNLWVNPDCGLKTRGWDETTQSLRAMVSAAKKMREEAGVL